MFWAKRRRPARSSLTEQHAQATVAESSAESRRKGRRTEDKEDKTPEAEEVSTESFDKKCAEALNRIEKKLQDRNKKYSEAFQKLEKVQQRKKNDTTTTTCCIAGASSCPSGSAHTLHGAASHPSVTADSSMLEDIREERPVPSGISVNRPSSSEKKVSSQTSCCTDSVSLCPCGNRHTLLEATVDSSVVGNTIEERGTPSESSVNQPSDSEQEVTSQTRNVQRSVSNNSNKNCDAVSKEAQSTHSYQDLEDNYCITVKGNDSGDERKFSSERKPCDGGEHLVSKEICSDGTKSKSNNQMHKYLFTKQNVNNSLMKVYLCNFCKIYYLYHESYKEHKKKCLTCPKCYLTFISISELYKHVTSKAHKEYFSFMEVCHWTQDQLQLRISRNEVLESDVKRMKSIKVTKQKELPVYTTDSGTIKILSSSHLKQENFGANASPCPDHVMSEAQENSDSHCTAPLYKTGTEIHSKSKEIISPVCKKEGRKPLTENNYEIVGMKEPEGSNGHGVSSGGNKNISISKSTTKESSIDHTPQNRHCASELLLKDKNERILQQNENTVKKASPEKCSYSEPSKNKKVLCKAAQKNASVCKPSCRINSNRTVQKVVMDSKPETASTKSKLQVEQSDKNSSYSKAPKIKNVLQKSSQKNVKERMPSHSENSNRTVQKAVTDSRPKETNIKSKVQVEQKGGKALEVNSKINIHKLQKGKQNKSKAEQNCSKIPEREQSSSNPVQRIQRSRRAPRTKNTSSVSLQETEGSGNGKSGKTGRVRTRELNSQEEAASPELKISHSSDSLTAHSSYNRESNVSKDADSFNTKASSSQRNADLRKEESVVMMDQTKSPRKRSRSLEESQLKHMKLVMKLVQVKTNTVVSCRKIDVEQEYCPGCSKKIDTNSAVYNTRTNHVSFWCNTCGWDIVFSTDV